MANAKVEVGVQIVQRWIVARLRNPLPGRRLQSNLPRGGVSSLCVS